jgi:SAM-dependent methyltransferase
MTTAAMEYGSHVSTNERSRLQKARKIEAILSTRVRLREVDVLDLGAGSGILSAYLKPRVRSITAADREPSVFQVSEIPIHRTCDADLPFANQSFDVVVYNHVIEHVGPRADQRRGICEIRRVLRPGGLLYLATPSRWAIIEPHYHLPFLSWLPANVASAWVRLLGRNSWYDCNPFGHVELIRFITDAGFAVEDATAEAFYRFLEIEKANTRIGRVLAQTPSRIVDAAVCAMPSFVVIAKSLNQH